MHTLLLCVAVTTLGIDVGWQRMPGGGMEYMIQLDPQTLESLRLGSAIQSDIPINAGEIRSYRITVGKERLPHETPSLPAPTPPSFKTPELKFAHPIERTEKRSFSASNPPRPFASDLGEKPLSERAAVFVNSPETTPKPHEMITEKATSDNSPDRTSRPWMPLTVTLLGLFASVGANIYLSWIAWDARRQLRQRPPV
jgi:hypothetical protein